jgi:hypothetical protein
VTENRFDLDQLIASRDVEALAELPQHAPYREAQVKAARALLTAMYDSDQEVAYQGAKGLNRFGWQPSRKLHADRYRDVFLAEIAR